MYIFDTNSYPEYIKNSYKLVGKNPDNPIKNEQKFDTSEKRVPKWPIKI